MIPLATLPAVAAYAVLDGLTLAVPADSWRITPRYGQDVVELDGLGLREGYLYPGADRELVAIARDFELSWEDLRGPVREALEELLAVPARRRLALWRADRHAFAGNGVRTTWTAPSPLAVHLFTPPTGLSPERFNPQVKVTTAGDPLDFVTVTTATFDAGEPDPGEVWWEDAGRRFKLAEAPEAGQQVHVRMVPAYLVLRAGQHSEEYRGPLRDPRHLLLREVWQ